MLRTTLALLLFTALGSVAHAGNNEVSITETARFLHTNSANAVTEDGMVCGALGYSRRVDLPALPNLTLWATGSFGWGTTSGEMFQTMTTDVGTLSLTAGGRARYELHRLVHATARLDVGTARASLTLEDEAGHSARDAGWGPISQAGVGLDLYAVNRRNFTFGMRLELGYVAMGDIDMTAKPDSESNKTLQLQMTAASLGGLNLSGSTFSASVVSQF
ncbi:MAG TPA: hypothetical protein VMZ53_02045 [Kofleriaceae bacterium]|nr:hypothetical protein [Kofleriaceae bacterium]